jgi:hypothetical protein
MTLYAYIYDMTLKEMQATEVEVTETEKQYTVEGPGVLPFLGKRKMLKSEIGQINDKDSRFLYNAYVVYLTERDGLKARQLILECLKAHLIKHEQRAAHFRSCVDSLM